MKVCNSQLLYQTLAGHSYNDQSLVELHAKRVAEHVVTCAYCTGYYDDALKGVASEIVRGWKSLGVPFWAFDTLDYVVRYLLLENQELESTEKDFGFLLLTCSACLFCLDRAVVHGRRGHIDVAERWLSAAQELRFVRLASPFSIQKTLAKSGAEAKDIKQGQLEKRLKIREIWATGKYSSRSTCAEQECAALGMSFDTARKALRNTPDPT